MGPRVPFLDPDGHGYRVIATSRFIAPSGGRQLLSVRLLFGGLQSAAMVTVHVWADPGGGGNAPGVELFHGAVDAGVDASGGPDGGPGGDAATSDAAGPDASTGAACASNAECPVGQYCDPAAHVVLVRFLVADDKAQAAAATALVERAVEADDPLFVSDVVLCEVVRVLAYSYKVARADLVAALGRLLRARHLSFAAVDLLARALAAFSAGKGDFVDYVIREHAIAAGCTTVATFDRALLKEAGFTKP